MLDFLQLPVVRLAMYALAVFRVSYMLWWEDGPGHIFNRLRTAAGIEYDAQLGKRFAKNGTFFGELLNCPLCLSTWFAILAVPAILYPSFLDLGALAFAISAVGLFLFQISEALG